MSQPRSAAARRSTPRARWIAAIAHAHQIPLVIDNTFGTPYLIRPIEHGADIVVHSATKFLGGHGTTLGGIIVDSGKFDWKAGGKYAPIAEANPSYHGISFVDTAGPAAFITYVRAILLRDTGAAISPFNAFLLLQGVETLSLRLDRHAENTKKVVEFLAHYPQVEKVNHPSLPDHPATTTHSQLSVEELEAADIYPNTIRFSIGTEHIDDILADLEKGFAAAAN